MGHVPAAAPPGCSLDMDVTRAINKGLDMRQEDGFQVAMLQGPPAGPPAHWNPGTLAGQGTHKGRAPMELGCSIRPTSGAAAVPSPAAISSTCHLPSAKRTFDQIGASPPGRPLLVFLGFVFFP